LHTIKHEEKNPGSFKNHLKHKHYRLLILRLFDSIFRVICTAYGVLRAMMFPSNALKLYTPTRQVFDFGQLKFNNWLKKRQWKEFSFNTLSTKLIQINELNIIVLHCCSVLHFSTNESLVKVPTRCFSSYLIEFFFFRIVPMHTRCILPRQWWFECNSVPMCNAEFVKLLISWNQKHRYRIRGFGNTDAMKSVKLYLRICLFYLLKTFVVGLTSQMSLVILNPAMIWHTIR
jgi:hypothetical protein